jgi:curved DNA-binding protein CbpA
MRHIDAYAVLAVRADATQAEIKAAYRRRAREYHPDLNGSNPAATERFQRLQAAYGLISEPTIRQHYDHTRQRRAVQQTIRQPYERINQEITMTIPIRLGQAINQALIELWNNEQRFGYQCQPLGHSWRRVHLRLTLTGERWLVEQLVEWIIDTLRLNGVALAR